MGALTVLTKSVEALSGRACAKEAGMRLSLRLTLLLEVVNSLIAFVSEVLNNLLLLLEVVVCSVEVILGLVELVLDLQEVSLEVIVIIVAGVDCVLSQPLIAFELLL